MRSETLSHFVPPEKPLSMTHQCPLCFNSGSVFHKSKTRIHYQCSTCFGIFANTHSLPSVEMEQAHYKKHNNNVEDKGYQHFVSPISNSILRHFSQNHKGLDFGAGTGPVLSKILTDNNFSVAQYDPYFHNHPKLLKKQYDYIASCEVIEHFYHPHKEFTLLRKLLKPNGKLYCMTHIYDESIDFSKWYYKNDPTHVFIYHKNTFQWIKQKFNFSDLKITDRLIIFSI